MRRSFVLELHGEWAEIADECIGLFLPGDASRQHDL